MTPKQIANAALEYIESHEEQCTQPVCHEKANLIAYLCHTIGQRDMRSVERILAEYDARCPGCAAHDGRN